MFKNNRGGLLNPWEGWSKKGGLKKFGVLGGQGRVPEENRTRKKPGLSKSYRGMEHLLAKALRVGFLSDWVKEEVGRK